MRIEKESKQKRGMRLLLILPLAIFFISMVSATTIVCDFSSISKTYSQGDLAYQDLTCFNSNNISVSITPSGETSLFSTSISSIPSNTSGHINISFLSNAALGLHSGLLTINDVSIPLSFLVNAPTTPPPSGCSINIFPTTLSNVKIAQADNPSTRNIQISVPSCFTSFVRVQGISLQTNQKPIQLGELSLGNIQPGQSMTIPINLDATNVQAGSYQDVLQFLFYNSSGNNIVVPNTDISVLVTSSISPITNFTQSQLPSCSVSPTDVPLNGTATFVCSLPNPNFDIETDLDNSYLVGISTQKTSTQYIYTFRGKQVGTTKFVARFRFQGGQVGDNFNQTLRVVPSSGSVNAGVNLDFVFYQNGNHVQLSNLGIGDTIVQVVDNSTRSLVGSHTLYLNGQVVNDTFNLNLNGNYELRAVSPGYLDYVANLSVSQTYIDLGLIPLKDLYTVGDTISINSTINNASLFMNDIPITTSYTFTRVGQYILRAEKEGYLSTTKNLTVQSQITILTSIPAVADWGKGNDVTAKMSQAGAWNVTYEPYDSNGNFQTAIRLNSGIGDEVKFHITENGRYNIYVDGVLVNSSIIKSQSFGEWVKKNLGWSIGGGAVILAFVVILIIRNRNGRGDSGDSDGSGYGPAPPNSPFQSG